MLESLLEYISSIDIEQYHLIDVVIQFVSHRILKFILKQSYLKLCIVFKYIKMGLEWLSIQVFVHPFKREKELREWRKKWK